MSAVQPAQAASSSSLWMSTSIATVFSSESGSLASASLSSSGRSERERVGRPVLPAEHGRTRPRSAARARVVAGTTRMRAAARAASATVRPLHRRVADELRLEPRDGIGRDVGGVAPARAGRAPSASSKCPASPSARAPRSAIATRCSGDAASSTASCEQLGASGRRCAASASPSSRRTSAPIAGAGGGSASARRRNVAALSGAPRAGARSAAGAQERRRSRGRPRGRCAAGAARRARGRRAPPRACARPGVPLRELAGAEARAQRAGDQRMRERQLAGRPRAARPRAARPPSGAASSGSSRGERGGMAQRRAAAEHGDRARERRRAVGQPGELALDAAGDLLRPERAQPGRDLVGRGDPLGAS